MTALLQQAFADTSFWIALVVKQDQYHVRAQTADEHFRQAGFRALEDPE